MMYGSRKGRGWPCWFFSSRLHQKALLFGVCLKRSLCLSLGALDQRFSWFLRSAKDASWKEKYMVKPKLAKICTLDWDGHMTYSILQLRNIMSHPSKLLPTCSDTRLTRLVVTTQVFSASDNLETKKIPRPCALPPGRTSWKRQLSAR